MFRLAYFLFTLSSTWLLSACAAQHTTFQSNQPPVSTFIQKMVVQDHFSETNLNTIFSKVHIIPATLKAIQKPKESIWPWYRYRQQFITPENVETGIIVQKQYIDILAKEERTYGVPQNIVLAILGVETRYGKNVGQYEVINTLATLAFEYPPRATFFQNELRDYLLLTRAQSIDPFSLYGSYAGAFGPMQFMPSSYRQYAVRYPDALSAVQTQIMADAMMSVGKYLNAKGWHPGEPVALPISGEIHCSAFKTPNTLHATTTIGALRACGITINHTLPNSLPAGIAQLETIPNQFQYVVLYPNFYVLLRYNPHTFYAMAVFELSEAIRRLSAKSA